MPRARYKRRQLMALPVFRAWKPHPDDYIDAESGLHSGAELLSLDPAYLVPFHFRLEPKFLRGFFTVPPISTLEKAQIEEKLRRSLSRESVKDLNDAVGRFVAGVGLASRIPPWKEFASHLDTIVKRTEELISLTVPDWNDGVQRGVMTAPEAINHYLRHRGYQNNIQLLHNLALEEFEKAQYLASRKGRRGDINYRLFLETLVIVAKSTGDRLSLPGNESKGTYGDRKSTPLMGFACYMIKLACERGLESSERSTLTATEKTKTRDAFLAIRKKSYGAVLDQLRNSVYAMTEDEFIDRHPGKTR